MSGQAGSNRVNFTTSIEEWENEWLSFSNEEVENNGALGKKIRFRICHEDDFVKNMEAPCSCNGSLKFTRNECIHKWCNEKNDTTCEICHQPYDGYNVGDQEKRLSSLNYARDNTETRRGGPTCLGVQTSANKVNFSIECCHMSKMGWRWRKPCEIDRCLYHPKFARKWARF